MAATLTGFRSYANERGYKTPALADDADAEAAIMRATDYVDMEYVLRFIPNCTAVDTFNIELAIYEAALAELMPDGALREVGFWNAVYTPNDQKVLTEARGIKWTLVGDGARVAPHSPRIEALLAACLPIEAPGVGLWAIG